MFKLVWKDIKFNKNHVIISIVVCLIASIALTYEKIDFSFMGFYLCSMLIFAYVVGKSCQKDEEGSTIGYVKTLPLSNQTIVTAKHLLSIITFFLAWVIIKVANLILPILYKEPILLSKATLLTLFGISLIYMGIFLFLYFKYGYANAQYTVLALLVGLFFIKRITGRNPSIIDNLNTKTLSMIIFTIGFIIFLISWFISSRRSIYEDK